MIGGSERTGRRRADVEVIMRANLELSDRHRKWGDDVPMVDLDYLLVEYNHSVAVAIIDYKFHLANLSNTNKATNQTLSGLHDGTGRQLPFFIVRYWPDIWAFKIKAVNESGIKWLNDALADLAPDRCGIEWVDLNEYQYVFLLYRLRKDVLSLGDERYLEKLNRQLPPPEARAA